MSCCWARKSSDSKSFVFEEKNLLFLRAAEQRMSHTAGSFVGSYVDRLYVQSVYQTAVRGGCWERTGHPFWQIPLCCQFWWNRNNHESIMDLNPDCGSDWTSAMFIIDITKISAQNNTAHRGKTDIWLRYCVLTSFSFRHQTIKLVPWRAQSQRWTCSALVRHLC